jgi:hypothetical protein
MGNGHDRRWWRLCLMKSQGNRIEREPNLARSVNTTSQNRGIRIQNPTAGI